MKASIEHLAQAMKASRRQKTVRILGTHGVPANYGGFETAAENIARFLEQRGWRVIVYCQAEGTGPIIEDIWNGIERVIIPIDLPGWRGTTKFDWISIGHACRFDDVCLTFGYNTGIFNVRQFVRKIPNIINMDGIEWSRKRWGLFKQSVLYVNERIAAFLGDTLIADHPEIERYLWTRAPKRKVIMIAYGADPVLEASTDAVLSFGLQPSYYMTLIARSIPENSILELVKGFSARSRGLKLAVLGDYNAKRDRYHRMVTEAASDEVLFLGSVYDTDAVKALRFHSKAYLHGHTVGGTNPSLVEAMATGNPVIAHDNAYNRWVAGEAGVYFVDAETADTRITEVLADDKLRTRMKSAALARHSNSFTWEQVGADYEQLLLRFLS